MGKKVKIKKVNPVVQYVGSFIQQNHGETLDNHGYLLWDVESRSFTEHEVKNDWGYMTIDIDDNCIPDWVYEEKDNLPKHPRIRVRFSNTDPSDMKIRLTELQTMFSTNEISYSRTDTMTNMKAGKAINDKLVGNVKDVTVQNGLIKEYLTQNFSVDEDDITKIIEINNEINHELIHKNEIVDNNIIWEPVSFKFSNMFSYGDDNLIRFNSLRGLVGLFAPNASGKSSIWDSLAFCLFDKCSRAYKAEHIMNSRKETFKCKFEFIIDGETYFIERRAKTYRKGTKVKVDVDFWKIDDIGEEVNLNGEQRRDTNKKIEQYLGTYDDFILTALSLQGNNALFIDKSQSERQDILSQFIGVDQFEKLNSIASQKNKEKITLIKKFKRDDFSAQLAELLERLKSEKKKYASVDDELKALKKEENALQTTIEQLNEKLIQLDDDIKDIDDLNSQLETIESSIEKIEEQKKQTTETITELEAKKQYFTDVIDEIDVDTLKERKKKLSDLRKEKSEHKHRIEKVELKIDNERERLKANEDYEYDEECEFCVTNAEHVIHVREEANKKLIEYNLFLNEETEQLSEVEDDIEKYKDVEKELGEYEKYSNSLSSVNQELIDKRETKLRHETKLNKLGNQKQEVEKNIQSYYDHEKDFKHNEAVREEIVEYRSELSDVRDELDEANQELLRINGSLSTIKNQKDTLIERINEVKELEEYHKLLEYYLEAVHRNGIPYDLITKSMPALEGEINNILSQTVDFTIEMEVDGKNINANLHSNDEVRPLEMCSGMERFISGMAIRVALINICHLPRPNFLVIDEGLGTLDSEHLQSVFMLFDYLKTQFEFVVLISHLDTSRDFADKLIEIRKDEEGFSSIRV